MEETIELTDYLRMIKKNWLLALALFILILNAAVAYTVFAPRVYEAQSLVMVTQEDQTSMLLDSSLFRIDMETQREIVLSMSVLEPIYTEYGDIFTLDVVTVKNSNVLEINVLATDPDYAVDIADKIADSYALFTRESKRTEAEDVRDFITEQLDSYKSELDTLYGQLSNYDPEDNQYRSIQHSIDAKQSIYEHLLSRKEEVGIAAKERSGNVKIIEYAEYPTEPSKPNVFLNIVLGVFMAFMISAGVVIAKEHIADRFTSAKDAEKTLGKHIIGSIANIKPLRKRKYMIIGYGEKFFPSGSLRKLRANLMQGDAKVITITSPRSKVGKSMITANLAVSLGKAGKKVLLVDANLKEPVLDKAFGQKHNLPGLVDALKSNGKADKLKVNATKYENVFLLPAGKLDRDSLDLITAEKIKNISDTITTSDFDIVLFDTASIEYAHSAVVCANTQTLLVVSGKTGRMDALHAKEVLEKVDSTIIGAIWNNK